MIDIKKLVNQFEEWLFNLENTIKDIPIPEITVEYKLLKEKLKDADNYKNENDSSIEISQEIIKIKEEISSLENAKRNISYQMFLIDEEIAKKQEYISNVKNQLDSLDLNDVENYKYINEQAEKIKKVKLEVANLLKEKELCSIDFGKNSNRISNLTEKLNYNEKLVNKNNKSIDEDKKVADENRLSKLDTLIKIYDVYEMVKQIYYNLCLLNNRRLTESDKSMLKNNFDKLNSVISNININTDKLAEEKQIIINLLDGINNIDNTSDDGQEIEKQISLYQMHVKNDKQILDFYENSLKLLNNEIKKLQNDNKNIQNTLVSLNLKRINGSAKKYIELLNRQIRSQEKMITFNNKAIEKNMKAKLGIDFAISAIKKKKRSFESIIEEKKQIFEEDFLNFNPKVNLLDIYEETQNLTYIDVIIKSCEIINYCKGIYKNIEASICESNDEGFKINTSKAAKKFEDQGLKIIKFGEAPLKNVDEAEKKYKIG